MNRVRIVISLLFVLFWSIANAKEDIDSLVLSRVYSYERVFNDKSDGFASNVYTKHLYQINRRNFTLWLVPTMYSVADGERQHVSEQYERMHFYGLNEFESDRQAFYTTIRHNRRPMSVLTEFTTPSLYHTTLYGDHILSPFCRENHRYYRYSAINMGHDEVHLYFRPRFLKNTQLVTGTASIELSTGRILSVDLKGEYDMIRFQTIINQGDVPPQSRSLLPKYCETNIDFNFMGNKVSSSFTAVYDCPIRLADTVNVKGDRHLLDSIRPLALSDVEQRVYDHYDSAHTPKPDTLPAVPDTLTPAKKRRNYFLDGFDFLVSSHRASSEKYYVKLSPIIEPQYISYSRSKGLTYKMRFSAQYYFNDNAGLYFNPQLSYHFKIHKFYLSAPLRYVYNKEHNNYVELRMNLGNRIGNSTVLDEIRREQGDIASLDDIGLDEFNDNEFKIYNNTQLFNWLTVEIGTVFHRRNAVNPQAMRQYGKPTRYQSLAPSIGVKLRPFSHGALFSIDYERGLKLKGIDLKYERWEADMSYKHNMTSLQTFNLRVGAGLYTNKAVNYFMDFANFRDNNLPDGWNDDWSGEFQLLSSRLYNESKYYLRSNISYEAPLLLASFIPLVGCYVERECFYWNALNIEHSPIYSEVGYGFTTRYISIGAFASFLKTKYQSFGAKFTFQLFRRW